MHDLIALLISVLAVTRVTAMIVWERGPFDLFSTLRGEITARFGEKHWLAEGIACPWCVSFWVALMPTLVLSGGWPPVTWWLAVAGGAFMLLQSLDMS